MDRFMECDTDDKLFLFQAGGVFVLLGDHDEAIEILERAVAKGFNLWGLMAHDYDLDPLRGNPDFERLQDSIKP
jgi:hypothetical protein